MPQDKFIEQVNPVSLVAQNTKDCVLLSDIIKKISEKHCVKITKSGPYQFMLKGKDETSKYISIMSHEGWVEYLPIDFQREIIYQIHSGLSELELNSTFALNMFLHNNKESSVADVVALYSESFSRGLYKASLYPYRYQFNMSALPASKRIISSIYNQSKNFKNKRLRQIKPCIFMASTKALALEALVMFATGEIDGMTKDYNTSVIEYLEVLEKNYKFDSIITSTDCNVLQFAVYVYNNKYQIFHQINENKYIIYSSIINQIKSQLNC